MDLRSDLITLTATDSGLDYQWVDCDNANTPIDGATEQSFEVTEDGNYAVIVSDGDCSVTSECTVVIVTGITEQNGADAFSVYPNPFNEMLTVRTNGQQGPVRIELFSMSGQVLINEVRSGMEMNPVGTAQLAPGSYVLRLTTDNARTTMNVVK